MYGRESWTIKEAEYWRIDAFELWCWRWLLRVTWTARRSYQSILNEISPEYSLEGLMLKLKLKSFFFLFILFFNFTILYWFCHISTWICHRYTRVPILNPLPSSLPVPSLWVVPMHQPQASSMAHQTWIGDSFHIWYYTCFSSILPSHPTLSFLRTFFTLSRDILKENDIILFRMV